MSQLSTITFSLSTKTGNNFCPENAILFFSTNRIGIDSNFTHDKTSIEANLKSFDFKLPLSHINNKVLNSNEQKFVEKYIYKITLTSYFINFVYKIYNKTNCYRSPNFLDRILTKPSNPRQIHVFLLNTIIFLLNQKNWKFTWESGTKMDLSVIIAKNQMW